jgi:hypothetical protein
VSPALGELFQPRHFIASAMELCFVAEFVGLSDPTRPRVLQLLLLPKRVKNGSRVASQ